MHKVLFFATLSLLSACGGTPSEPPPPTTRAETAPVVQEAPAVNPKVAKAAAISREVNANPGDAVAILSKHGLDQDGLDALMVEIATDPALSAAYEAERRKPAP